MHILNILLHFTIFVSVGVSASVCVCLSVYFLFAYAPEQYEKYDIMRPATGFFVPGAAQHTHTHTYMQALCE